MPATRARHAVQVTTHWHARGIASARRRAVDGGRRLKLPAAEEVVTMRGPVAAKVSRRCIASTTAAPEAVEAIQSFNAAILRSTADPPPQVRPPWSGPLARSQHRNVTPTQASLRLWSSRRPGWRRRSTWYRRAHSDAVLRKPRIGPKIDGLQNGELMGGRLRASPQTHRRLSGTTLVTREGSDVLATDLGRELEDATRG
jgi:hypothetical protein